MYFLCSVLLRISYCTGTPNRPPLHPNFKRNSTDSIVQYEAHNSRIGTVKVKFRKRLNLKQNTVLFFSESMCEHTGPMYFLPIYYQVRLSWRNKMHIRKVVYHVRKYSLGNNILAQLNEYRNKHVKPIWNIHVLLHLCYSQSFWPVQIALWLRVAANLTYASSKGILRYHKMNSWHLEHSKWQRSTDIAPSRHNRTY